MARSLCRILIHLVFSTKNRDRMITPAIQPGLFACLSGILKGIGCPPPQTGRVDDHIHILFGLSRTRTVSSVVETHSYHYDIKRYTVIRPRNYT